jgi:hypothetical protein
MQIKKQELEFIIQSIDKTQSTTLDTQMNPPAEEKTAPLKEVKK